MKNTMKLWKIIIKNSNGSVVTRYKRSSKLTIGSDYGSTLILTKDFPGLLCEVHSNSSGNLYVANGSQNLRVHDHMESLVLEFGEMTFEVSDETLHRQPLRFDATKATHSETSEQWTLWHFVGGVLLESESLKAANDPIKDPFVKLRSGLEIQWQLGESKLVIKMPSGEFKARKAIREAQGSYSVSGVEESYVLSRVATKETYEFLPKDFHQSSDAFNKYLVAFLASWLLMIAVLNFSSHWLSPIDEDAIAQEELPELMKKVTIAKQESKREKIGRGGNNMAGGGGIDASKNDPRGGGGFVTDQVVVSDLQSFSGGSGVFDAIGALDKKMAANGVQTASIGPSGATANSILGALGALGAGNKKGGGGLGLGGVGTKGFGGGGGGGAGSGFGAGTGSGLGMDRGPRQLNFEAGDSDVRGGLDRSEVDAVVRQNLAQIRFCYNRGLRSHPDLNGRVTSNFVIGADGQVKSSNIRQSTLGVPTVDDCIRQKVSSWAFPRPRGGGEVTVNYPFLLKAN